MTTLKLYFYTSVFKFRVYCAYLGMRLRYLWNVFHRNNIAEYIFSYTYDYVTSKTAYRAITKSRTKQSSLIFYCRPLKPLLSTSTICIGKQEVFFPTTVSLNIFRRTIINKWSFYRTFKLTLIYFITQQDYSCIQPRFELWCDSVHR